MVLLIQLLAAALLLLGSALIVRALVEIDRSSRPVLRRAQPQDARERRLPRAA